MATSADQIANALYDALTKGMDFQIPMPDFSGDGWDIPNGSANPIFELINKLTPADVTEMSLTGNGAFDVFMKGMSVQLAKEYEAGRITGADYTKAFIALTQSALTSSVQFVLQKDQAFWQGAQAQAATIAARVSIEQAKVQVAALQLEALTNEANFALTKMRIALTKEQYESQRGQTLDTTSDGTTISGILGEQKQLYAQQIVSYQRDAEVKAAKLFTDAWVTMKTVDDGLDPPDNFTNNSLNGILQTLITNNNFS